MRDFECTKTRASLSTADGQTTPPHPLFAHRLISKLPPPLSAIPPVTATPPGQVAFCQQKPTVPGMLYQPVAGLEQPLLQAGQPPVGDRLGQRQPPPQVAGIIGEHAQPQAHSLAPKRWQESRVIAAARLVTMKPTRGNNFPK